MRIWTIFCWTNFFFTSFIPLHESETKAFVHLKPKRASNLKFTAWSLLITFSDLSLLTSARKYTIKRVLGTWRRTFETYRERTLVASITFCLTPSIMSFKTCIKNMPTIFSLLGGFHPISPSSKKTCHGFFQNKLEGVAV